LQILQSVSRNADIRSVEQLCSSYFHTAMASQGYRVVGWKCPPPIPSDYVDATDKSGWVVPYNNIMHYGKIEERHLNFLAKEGDGFDVQDFNRGLVGTKVC
jgi:hypothetical protein